MMMIGCIAQQIRAALLQAPLQQATIGSGRPLYGDTRDLNSQQCCGMSRNVKNRRGIKIKRSYKKKNKIRGPRYLLRNLNS